MKFGDKKKQKKAAQLKKNRELSELLNLFRLRRQETDRVQKEDERLKSRPVEKSSAEEGEWRDKVAVVRNRLTGKKRVSRERWNRFAGTGGEGGRGL